MENFWKVGMRHSKVGVGEDVYGIANVLFCSFAVSLVGP